MAKKVTRKKSKTSLQKEISKLKKLKKEAAERKKLFVARAKEIEEIRELRREARELSGVGTKRRLAGQVTKRLGTDVGRVGWKGLKIIGKFAKERLEAEARAQDRESAMRRAKAKPKTKRRKR